MFVTRSCRSWEAVEVQISTSMVGRIVTQLKRQGQLIEAPRGGYPAAAVPCIPGLCNPQTQAVRGFPARRPGPSDTLKVRPVPGMVFKQFTTRDVVSRWNVIQAHTRATAFTAAQFLDTLQHRLSHSRSASRRWLGVRRRVRWI